MVQQPDSPIGDYYGRHLAATGEAPLIGTEGGKIGKLAGAAIKGGITRDDLRALMDVYFGLYAEGRDNYFAHPSAPHFFAAATLEKLRAIRRGRGSSPAQTDTNAKWSAALQAIKAVFPDGGADGVTWRGMPFYSVRVGDTSASLDAPDGKVLDMVGEVVNALGARPLSAIPEVLASLCRRAPATGAA